MRPLDPVPLLKRGSRAFVLKNRTVAQAPVFWTNPARCCRNFLLLEICLGATSSVLGAKLAAEDCEKEFKNRMGEQ